MSKNRLLRTIGWCAKNESKIRDFDMQIRGVDFSIVEGELFSESYTSVLFKIYLGNNTGRGKEVLSRLEEMLNLFDHPQVEKIDCTVDIDYVNKVQKVACKIVTKAT